MTARPQLPEAWTGGGLGDLDQGEGWGRSRATEMGWRYEAFMGDRASAVSECGCRVDRPYAILHYTTLYYTILYYTILHDTILCYNKTWQYDPQAQLQNTPPGRQNQRRPRTAGGAREAKRIYIYIYITHTCLGIYGMYVCVYIHLSLSLYIYIYTHVIVNMT